jgi:uncharacterized protein DUF547
MSAQRARWNERCSLGGLLALCLAFAAHAQSFDHSHQAWDALLKKHVVLISGGKASQVRYAGLAQERAALRAYLNSLSGVSEAQFDGWTKPQRMAFLINAYNAFTVEKILTRYPNIKSIWDFGRLFGNPFKDKFFALLGREFTLDGIEHDTLRKPGAYEEPRVHYAVNCAAIGCPMLREEAYVAERLERQLAEQERRFLSDRSRNRFRDGRLEVSRIYDWFEEDFAPREQYFGRHAKLLSDNPEHQRLVAAGAAKISFLDYDWSLNDSPSSSRR